MENLTIYNLYLKTMLDLSIFWLFTLVVKIRSQEV